MKTLLHRHRIRSVVTFVCIVLTGVILVGRLCFLMIFCARFYREEAEELHQRERRIKAARGEIVDCNGVVLAANKTVCSISVIYSQIKEPETVAAALSRELGMEQETVEKKVRKKSSRELIASNVDLEIGEKIRLLGLAGVKVDEDTRRYYPLGNLASRVLGFTGKDNQGIVGLEVKYESILKGVDGKILAGTDAAGRDLESMGEERIDPVKGLTLEVSLDANVQAYAQQAAEVVMEQKRAKGVSIIIMNPQNGEIIAMVNVPEYDLNHPFELSQKNEEFLSDQEKQNQYNQMWRNPCINDTYEPGSTFKIITASAALEEGVVSLTDRFVCPGYRIVADRKIRCHKTGGHGTETFLEGAMNSCNPVFIEVGLRLGVEKYCEYFDRFGLRQKTGIDLPGEASTIMHQSKNMGEVELATVSFGQSFQITPIQLITTASSLINGGYRVTPHFAVKSYDEDHNQIHLFSYSKGKQIISEQTSTTLREILYAVVEKGSGKNARVEGYAIGGKTATSEKLPRSRKQYISSFLGFTPVDNPKIIALITIDEPQGIYYGGTIAAPVIADIFQNILPFYS